MAPKRKSAFASQQVAKVPKKTLNASATRRMSAAQSQAVNDSSDEDVNDSPDEDAVQNPATRVLRPRVNGKAQVATSASKTFRDIAQEMGGPIMPGTSFKNMQLLPAELQIQIWKDAQRSSPAVHFCVARAIENIDYYDNLHNTKTCSLELSPAQKITDDSAWRINTPLSHICSAALRASFIRPEHEALLRLTQGTHRIAGHTDLLCLKMNFGIPDGKPHHVWPRGNNFSLHDGSIDHDAVKQQLKGFHKIGLWNEPDDPWRKFTCLTMQFAIGAVCGHRLFPEAICPIQLAGFIDSCPDIEEFYLVVPKYGVTPTSKSRKAKEARTWSASRKSMIFRCHNHNQRFKYTNHDVCGRRSVPEKIYWEEELICRSPQPLSAPGQLHASAQYCVPGNDQIMRLPSCARVLRASLRLY